MFSHWMVHWKPVEVTSSSVKNWIFIPFMEEVDMVGWLASQNLPNMKIGHMFWLMILIFYLCSIMSSPLCNFRKSPSSQPTDWFPARENKSHPIFKKLQSLDFCETLLMQCYNIYINWFTYLQMSSSCLHLMQVSLRHFTFWKQPVYNFSAHCSTISQKKLISVH